MHGYIERSITQKVLDNLQEYPVVALLGARQVGKSTLAKKIFASFEHAVFLDLESPRDLNKLQDAEAFLELN